MKILDSIRFRLSAVFHRSQVNADLEEELRSHIELRADDLERSGVPRHEAERRARLEFGSDLRFREECQDAAGWTFVESLFMDLRFAIRKLRKSPGFTIVAVITLALAIGANAVVFAALNAVVLRPLNVPRAESLYSIHRINDNGAAQSYPTYIDFRDRNRSFEDLVGYGILTAGLDAGQNPSRIWVIAATANYFDALGIQPQLGRFFHGSDEHGPNSAPYIVLSHAFWHSRFQNDPAIVGKIVQLNKHPFTVIGVAPEGFRSTLLFLSPDIYLPLVNAAQLEPNKDISNRSNRWIFMTLGHLKPGVTPEQAAADMDSISKYLEQTYPSQHRHIAMKLGRPSLYGDFIGRPVTAFLTALMLLAGLILLAACANLGNLFAARAADRSREVALRLALGAGRVRILRQLFTEAMLISLLGGAIGLWGSIVLLSSMRAWQPFPQFPIHLPLSPDANVFGVALLLTLASGLLFGAVPVRQVLRTDPYQVVKAGSTAAPGKRFTGRDVLVVAQIAICAVLVTSSLVAVRGLVRSMHGNFGFDPHNAMLVETILDMAGYQPDVVPATQKRMIEAMQTIPGVKAVGLVDAPALTNGDFNSSLVFTDETVDLRPGNSAATVATLRVSPEYFTAAATALLSGRPFTWHDDKDQPRVAVINSEFARRLFGSTTDAIGKVFKIRDGSRVQVVGIAEDGKFQSLTEDPRPAMYLPILQSPSSESSLVIRSDRDPQQLSAAIKDKLREIDPGLPSFIQTYDDAMNLPLFPSRVATVSLGVLGMMGALLSMTGVFGLAAYSVSRRMREFGIRMALGAQRYEVVRAALGRALKLLGVGSLAGIVLGLLATRVLAHIVYQATPRDPLVLTSVVIAMAFIGLLATWIPAQRALSVDPLVLLRED
jgi:predicted permease